MSKNCTMVQAFSQNSIKFDHDPTNEELTVLLGDSDHWGHIAVHETLSLLVAGPGLIPIWIFAPWVLFTAVTLTVLMFVVPRFGGNPMGAEIWPLLVVLWVLIVPTSIAFIVWLNKYVSAKGDYFKVDKVQRTLDLCRLGRKFDAREIKSFTDISRRHRQAGWSRQIGVLVQCEAAEWELFPLVCETTIVLRKKQIADMLGDVFGVPVRRQKLGWRASSASRDNDISSTRAV